MDMDKYNSVHYVNLDEPDGDDPDETGDEFSTEPKLLLT